MIKDLIQTVFYEADIFKVPFVLLFQNRKKSSTVQGALFSFSITAIVLYHKQHAVKNQPLGHRSNDLQ